MVSSGVDTRGDCPCRYAEDLGALVVAEPEHVNQHTRCSLIRCQRVERCGKVDRPSGVCLDGREIGQLRGGSASLNPQDRHRLGVDDASYPRFERGHTKPICPEPSIRSQVRLLQHVVALICDQPSRQHPQPGVDRADQVGERSLVTSLRGSHQSPLRVLVVLLTHRPAAIHLSQPSPCRRDRRQPARTNVVDHVPLAGLLGTVLAMIASTRPLRAPTNASSNLPRADRFDAIG